MIKRVVFFIFNIFFRRNVIILESLPSHGGSPRCIEEWLINHPSFHKMKFYWAVDKKENFKDGFENVPFWGGLNLFEKLRKNFLMARALLILDSNRPVNKLNPFTQRYFMRHGGTLKKCDKYMWSLGPMDYILSTSTEIADIDYSVLKGKSVQRREQVLDMGLPVNDAVFESFDLYATGFLKNRRYSKIIAWLPTFRQHKNNDASISIEETSEISLPLISSVAELEKLDASLSDMNVLLIAQLHHAQIAKLPNKIFSNIHFITQKEKEVFGITNPRLFQCSDALITDYSAAYCEYVLLDKPIALCIDDYEEYSSKIGFYVDFKKTIRGEELCSVDDLIAFARRICDGKDVFKEERNKAAAVIHKYRDNGATERVANFIVKNLS